MNYKKLIFLVVFIVAVTVLALLFTQFIGPGRKGSPQPLATPPAGQQDLSAAPDDQTMSIEQDLGTLNLGDLDAEFQAVDADLNSL